MALVFLKFNVILFLPIFYDWFLVVTVKLKCFEELKKRIDCVLAECPL